ncbi:hypothetical protein HBN50_06570 [Halobacteriovorax sp. GB3]|uniref:hypothetical protein n=1 Tax=Halobacteriovorax sp. GB3 TaxID=2719615 RepID=UPI0023627D8A|nr:hypothetical protein [Halobacteriovorax sp. GB3]MDD0852751.1 hypothetical protein [Halobacteriovorax sp. GB3]
MKYLLILLITITSSFANQQQELTIDLARQSLNEAKAISGDVDDMGQRALFLHSLYLDSKKNFPFALSISHLTLGIETSSYLTDKAKRTLLFFKMKEMMKDFNMWGKELRSLNRFMVTHLYFAYTWAKKLHANKLSVPSNNPFEKDDELFEVYRRTSYLYWAFEDMNWAIENGITLPEKTMDEHFELFVDWEHRLIIQNTLKETYTQLNSLLQMTLRNVPSRLVEKLFLTPLTGLRTTMNLECFKEESYLRTPDFLDYNERIKQARSFYQKMKEIDFDPNNECYNDEYYLSKFPAHFIVRPEEYLRTLKIEKME